MDRLFALSLNPAHDVASAFLAGMKDFAAWTMSAIMSALNAMLKSIIDLIISAMTHTTPQFADTKFNPVQPALFNPIWSTMVKLGVTIAVILMVVGIIAAVFRGEPGLLGRQLGLGLLGILLMASPIIPDLVQALFDVINVASRYILVTALQLAHHQSLSPATSVTAQLKQAELGLGLPSYAGTVGAILLILGCILALLVWLELVAREAIAYLVMALVPLALAGLFFKGTSTWIKKAVEGIIAVALSQIIIAVVLALGFSSLFNAVSSDSLTAGALFVVFMFIATLGLPLALRVAPLALDAALVGTEISAMARRHGARVGKAAIGKGAGLLGGGAGAGAGAGGAVSKPSPQDAISSASEGRDRAGDAGASTGGGPKKPSPSGPSIGETMAEIARIQMEQSTPGTTTPHPKPARPRQENVVKPIPPTRPPGPTPGSQPPKKES